MLIDRTRIIYPEARRDVSLSVINAAFATSAAVVQMWIDDGDASADPENIASPFLISPPLARVAPDSRQTVRLTYTGEPQNTEQEGLYWFNMLEIPPAFKGPSDADRVTLARRSRIKVFFRPKGLKGDPASAMKQLQCELVNAHTDWFVECHNPSNFHLSFLAFALVSGDQKVHASDEGGMVKPLQRARFQVQNYAQMKLAPRSVLFDFINDYGGITPVDLALTRP